MAEKKRLLGCPACGFRVSGDEDTCSRCGARFGDQAKFECPFCGEPVSPDENRCPSCMVRFKDFSKTEKRASEKSIDGLLMEIIEKEAAEVKEQDKKLSCPMCSWLVDGSEQTCPKCGVIFSETVAYQCPVCAALISAETAKCGECGSVFLEADVEEPAGPVPSAPFGAPQAQPEPREVSPAPEIVHAEERGSDEQREAPRAEPKAEPQPEPEHPPKPEPVAQPEPKAPIEEPPKAEPKVIARPKVMRRKEIAKPAPKQEAPEEAPPETPQEPVKRQVRRRKLKAKPKK